MRIRSEGTFVVGVLIASVVVATMLAFQAISAARSRQAVSDAMLRQYAQLAAWEFSRAARRDIDATLTHTLAAYVHPENRNKDRCDCGPLGDVDYWFEIGPDGKVVERSGPIPVEVSSAIAQHTTAVRAGGMEGAVRLRPLTGDATRVIAFRAEPHTLSGGRYIGLVTRAESFAGLLGHTYRRAALLPAVLVGDRNTRGLVDLQVEDSQGRNIFASAETTPGPQVMTTEVFPDDSIGLRVRASMTPKFVATLGPEHGAGPNNVLVIGLVIVNALMVTVGLWQLRRERELAKLREDFVAGVSHELRTPLAQIRMFTDTLLLDRIRNPAEGRRAIEIIGQETRRLSQLVENVLYFHRHRRAPLATPGAPMDLSTFVLEVTEGFKPLAASKRVRLAVNIPAREVIAIASADGLRQVMLNLLDNAVKFGPPDDVVIVSLETSGGTARLMVEDRGAGVPVSARRRIFEPFERGEARGSGGAGIGLAVVRKIVTEHGGTVTVEDPAPGGARFVVSLPLAHDEPHESAARAG
jgi:signal transduction histidine kinase